MTLEEAMSILRKDIDNPGSVDIQDVNKAEQIAIEASERILKGRATFDEYYATLLPSETK